VQFQKPTVTSAKPKCLLHVQNRRLHWLPSIVCKYLSHPANEHAPRRAGLSQNVLKARSSRFKSRQGNPTAGDGRKLTGLLVCANQVCARHDAVKWVARKPPLKYATAPETLNQLSRHVANASALLALCHVANALLDLHHSPLYPSIGVAVKLAHAKFAFLEDNVKQHLLLLPVVILYKID
jgi:hypothetical protein